MRSLNSSMRQLFCQRADIIEAMVYRKRSGYIIFIFVILLLEDTVFGYATSDASYTTESFSTASTESWETTGITSSSDGYITSDSWYDTKSSNAVSTESWETTGIASSFDGSDSWYDKESSNAASTESWETTGIATSSDGYFTSESWYDTESSNAVSTDSWETTGIATSSDGYFTSESWYDTESSNAVSTEPLDTTGITSSSAGNAMIYAMDVSSSTSNQSDQLDSTEVIFSFDIYKSSSTDTSSFSIYQWNSTDISYSPYPTNTWDSTEVEHTSSLIYSTNQWETMETLSSESISPSSVVSMDQQSTEVIFSDDSYSTEVSSDQRETTEVMSSDVFSYSAEVSANHWESTEAISSDVISYSSDVSTDQWESTEAISSDVISYSTDVSTNQWESTEAISSDMFASSAVISSDQWESTGTLPSEVISPSTVESINLWESTETMSIDIISTVQSSDMISSSGDASLDQWELTTADVSFTTDVSSDIGTTTETMSSGIISSSIVESTNELESTETMNIMSSLTIQLTNQSESSDVISSSVEVSTDHSESTDAFSSDVIPSSIDISTENWASTADLSSEVVSSTTLVSTDISELMETTSSNIISPSTVESTDQWESTDTMNIDLYVTVQSTDQIQSSEMISSSAELSTDLWESTTEVSSEVISSSIVESTGQWESTTEVSSEETSSSIVESTGQWESTTEVLSEETSSSIVESTGQWESTTEVSSEETSSSIVESTGQWESTETMSIYPSSTVLSTSQIESSELISSSTELSADQWDSTETMSVVPSSTVLSTDQIESSEMISSSTELSTHQWESTETLSTEVISPTTVVSTDQLESFNVVSSSDVYVTSSWNSVEVTSTVTTTTESSTTTTTESPTTTTTEPTTTTITTTEPTTTTTTTTEPTTTTITTTPTTAATRSANFEGDDCPDGRLLPYTTDICHRADDWSYGPIKLKGIFLPACDKTFTQIYVNPNGYIALGKNFQSYWPIDLKYLRNDVNIVAFFWFDFTTQYDCNMYIDVYTDNKNGMLDKISTLVRRRHNNNYKANWAVVVTWKDAYGWPGLDRENKMTFQGVLTTDGDTTYYMAIYQTSTLTRESRIRYWSWWYGGWFVYTYWRAWPLLGWKCSTNNPAPLTRPRWYRMNRVFNIHNEQQPLNTNKYPTAKCKGLFIWKKISNKQKRSAASKKCRDWYRSESEDSAKMALIQWRAANWRFRCHCWEFFERWSGSRRNWHPYNTATRCYFKRTNWRLGFASMECCYRNGLLIRNGPDTGSYVTSQSTWWKTFRYRKYMNENIRKKKWCCKKSTNCNLYYAVRPKPSRFCAWWPMFFFGWFWGDPHINSLDGNTYTFNGLGEYTMINGSTNESSIAFQARTCKAWDKDGNPINATVFCAFSGKDDTGSLFRVELNSDTTRDKMFVYLNNEDWTYQFYNDDPFEPDLESMQVTKQNDSLEVVLESGAKFTFSVKAKTLSLETSIPDDFKGMVAGLLGNYDGDKSNDYTLPNGTVLEFKNYTEREIYYRFGSHWAITEEESLFNYTSEKPFSYYNDDEFVPVFSDEFSQAEKDAAAVHCPDLNNACIVDYLMTKDTALAQSSGDTQASSASSTSSLENQTPQISGPDEVIFTIGQSMQLEFNATDDGTITYQVIDQPSSGAFSFDNNTGVLSWAPSSSTEESISITVKDDKGVEAAPVNVKILICPTCNGHGTCDTTTVRSGDDTLMHNVYACNCSAGWSGDDCDEDEDACLLDPCAEGQNCTDLTPEDEIIFDRGYNCSDCATGYQLQNNKCEDNDECNSTNTCDQECVNSAGSYECRCYSGYRRATDVCTDIDECQEGTYNCQQVCTNIAGNYTCSCYFGFDLQSDGQSCTKVQDICPLYNLTCSYGCANNTDDVMVCACQNGYKVDTDGSSCIDINECQANICSQKCTNSAGSFSCSCLDGYKLNSDKSSCDPCEEEYWGPSCVYDCDCTDGSDRCDSATGCVCNQYYTGQNCTEDVDECTVTPTICGTDKTCTNEEGSYDCNCLTGYVDDGSGNCIDINECDESDANEDLDEYEHNCTLSQSTCENINGGFTCRCSAGYNQNGAYDCIDIDECAAANHGCDHICKNMQGSYYCECYVGYALNDTDRKTCEKMSDPCASFNISCSYSCIIENSSPKCVCQSGFSLASDSVTCLDIDECAIDSENKCGEKDKCVNTAGGFTCSCSDGYLLENDGRSCTECDSFHYGTNCAQTCSCHQLGAERCDKVSGCLCNDGWAGQNCNTDINECLLTPARCQNTNEECVNTLGSYECRCKTGFTNSSGTCINDDECSTNTDRCAQGCVDTDGSYTCTCQKGFRVADDGFQCEDIDECTSGLATCGQLCVNSIGSYRCSCNDGFLLNTTDRRQCYVKTECNVGHSCTQNCGLNSTFHEICSCNLGYELNADGVTCDNINECSLSNPCKYNCTDTSPGYICSCQSGKKIDVDKVTCIDCTEGTYGINCDSNCTCVADNTESCNKTTGECTCVSGYEGTNCETNIDECATGSAQCDANSACRDTNGSYACDCNLGYTMATPTTCIECSGLKYGLNCQSTCVCVTANTISCNKTNGYCTCKTGWNGTDCGTDINECEENPNLCTHGKQCTNKAGTYECKCATGYAENATNWCTDVDECYRTTDNCSVNANCTNTEGGFTCTCKDGYDGDGYTCNVPPVINIVAPNLDSKAITPQGNAWIWFQLFAFINVFLRITDLIF